MTETHIRGHLGKPEGLIKILEARVQGLAREEKRYIWRGYPKQFAFLWATLEIIRLRNLFM